MLAGLLLYLVTAPNAAHDDYAPFPRAPFHSIPRITTLNHNKLEPLLSTLISVPENIPAAAPWLRPWRTVRTSRTGFDDPAPIEVDL